MDPLASKIELPGWIISDEESVRNEVSEWRHMTPAKRWSVAKSCARDMRWAVRLNKNPQRILDQIDPLPKSTEVALARLRRELLERK